MEQFDVLEMEQELEKLYCLSELPEAQEKEIRRYSNWW